MLVYSASKLTSERQFSHMYLTHRLQIKQVVSMSMFSFFLARITRLICFAMLSAVTVMRVFLFVSLLHRRQWSVNKTDVSKWILDGGGGRKGGALLNKQKTQKNKAKLLILHDRLGLTNSKNQKKANIKFKLSHEVLVICGPIPLLTSAHVKCFETLSPIISISYLPQMRDLFIKRKIQ